jgi:hypothetical protein
MVDYSVYLDYWFSLLTYVLLTVFLETLFFDIFLVYLIIGLQNICIVGTHWMRNSNPHPRVLTLKI